MRYRYQLIRENLNDGSYVIAEFETEAEAEEARKLAEGFKSNQGWFLDVYDTEG